MERFTQMERKLGVFFVLLVTVGVSILLLYRLGAEPLQDYDEATYAQVVHESLENRTFFSFTYAGENYFKKPPLMFWAMDLSETFLGETPFAMRLPFALSGIVLVMVIMLVAFEISQSTFTAALAGAIASTTSPLMETARQVRMDVPVVLFIMAAIYCFLRGLHDRKWFLLFGYMAGLAVLTKSVIAVFAFIAAGCILLFYQRVVVLREKYFWYGIGTFLLVALPWHLYETTKFGWAFWRQYIGVEVVARTQENLFWTVTITNNELVHYLIEFFQPWLWVFLIVTVFFSVYWRRFEYSRRAGALMCLTTIACICGIFFSAATKAPTYFIPLYPLTALFIALCISPLSSKRAKIIATSFTLILVVFGACYTIYNAYHYNPYYSVTLTLARDEKTIGNIIAKTPPNSPWYVYSDENLGSIMFYSQHVHPLALLASSTPMRGSLIVLDTNAQSTFTNSFPNLETTVLYGGSQVRLLAVN